jgi:hypothetical protein
MFAYKQFYKKYIDLQYTGFICCAELKIIYELKSASQSLRHKECVRADVTVYQKCFHC